MATTRSINSSRSPIAISLSSIPRLKFVNTSAYGVKCQKNGRSSVIELMSNG